MSKLSVYVELDDAGVRAILNSPEVKALVAKAAKNAAAHAKKNAPKGVSVQTHTGKSTKTGNRASALVTVKAEVEAEHGLLARALGAAKL